MTHGHSDSLVEFHHSAFSALHDCVPGIFLHELGSFSNVLSFLNPFADDM